MGGWLGLAQQGLAPCKKCQASLGVLTSCPVNELTVSWCALCCPSSIPKPQRAWQRVSWAERQRNR